MRSRVVGTPKNGDPEMVVVPGLAVANYLQPACAGSPPGPART
jgi:hypothetical protein